ncbi:MAG: hypothetical protein K2N09_09495 [Muribaculaceae bacterium]|nr:hypothetical protein [Muribaculaceae bacterium]
MDEIVYHLMYHYVFQYFFIKIITVAENKMIDFLFLSERQCSGFYLELAHE